MKKHRSDDMNKKNEKNRQSAAAPRYAASGDATIALASDDKVTTTYSHQRSNAARNRQSSSDKLQRRHVESSLRILVRCKLRCTCNSAFSLLRSIRACKNGKHSQGGRSDDVECR